MQLCLRHSIGLTSRDSFEVTLAGPAATAGMEARRACRAAAADVCIRHGTQPRTSTVR
jgi:hypothetical protein